MKLLFKKSNLEFHLKKIVAAVGMVLLFALLSLYRGLGYNGEVQVRMVYTNYQLLYRDIEVNCSIVFNPVLFPFSWLVTGGQSSFRFLMRTAPLGVSEFGVAWPSLEETKEDALLIVVLNELFINIPFMLAIFLVIELMNLRSIYVCFFGGILGFLMIGLLGAIVGFTVIFLVIILLIRKFRIKGVINILDILWKQIGRNVD